MILTDHAYTILSLLRVRTDADTDVRFAIRETFSMETIKMDQPMATKDQYVQTTILILWLNYRFLLFIITEFYLFCRVQNLVIS